MDTRPWQRHYDYDVPTELRYPRIGAQIFFNVAKILSDRLEEARRAPPR